MRKVVIICTSVLLLISICSCSYFAYRYYSYNNIDKINVEIKKIEEEIKKNENTIKEKNQEIENKKNENSEKVKVLELWQKALNQVKQNS
jgi:hypothetical protein